MCTPTARTSDPGGPCVGRRTAAMLHAVASAEKRARHKGDAEDPAAEGGEEGAHARAPDFLTAAGTKLLAMNLRRQAQSRGIALKMRTAHGVVSQYGVHRIKVVAKERPALARGFFAASKGKPFAPIGGPIDVSEKNQAEIAAETLAAMRRKHEKTSLEVWMESKSVPIDDAAGLRVQLAPRSSTKLAVRLSELKVALVGRRRKLARRIMVAMLDREGNPDLFMTTAERLEEMGSPRREKNMWHVHDEVLIEPTDRNYSTTTYYITVASGVEPCSLRLVAVTGSYIPTITSALNGKYRPTGQEKNLDIGKTVIHPALNEANFRRKNSRAGCFPLAGYPLPHAIYASKGADPTVRPLSAMEIRAAAASADAAGTRQDLSQDRLRAASGSPTSHATVSPQLSTLSHSSGARQLGATAGRSNRGTSSSAAGNTTLEMSVPRSGAVSPQSEAQEEDEHPMARTRPRSALERAVDVTFKCTLKRVEADYDILDFKTVHTKRMKGLLKPKKLTYGHVGQEKRQLKALFGSATKDLRADKESFEEESNPSIGSARGVNPVPSGIVNMSSDLDAGKQADGKDVGEERAGEALKEGVREEGSTAVTEGIAEPSAEQMDSPHGVAAETEDATAKLGDQSVTGEGDQKLTKAETKPVKPKRRKNAPPLKVRLQWTPFRAKLIALLADAKPATRKMAGYEYQELMTPIASITGYAVIHTDDSRTRRLMSPSSGCPVQLTNGQTMLVQAGMEVPFGADAIVDPKFVLRESVNVSSGAGMFFDVLSCLVLCTTSVQANVIKLPTCAEPSDDMCAEMRVVVKDVPISGQHINVEVRPYYVGGDGPALPGARPGQCLCQRLSSIFLTVFVGMT